MKMRKTYQVAGHLWSVSGERLCRTMDSIDGFKPFEVESNGDNTADCLFCVEEADDDHAVPQFGTVQYTFPSDGVTNRFGITAEGCYLLEMMPQEEPVLRLWTAERSTPWHMYVGGKPASDAAALRPVDGIRSGDGRDEDRGTACQLHGISRTCHAVSR